MGVCSAWLEFPYTTELHTIVTHFFIPFLPFFIFLSTFWRFFFVSCLWRRTHTLIQAFGIRRRTGGWRAGRQDRTRQTDRQIGRQAGLCFFPQAKPGRLSLLIKIANREHLFLVFQLIDLLFAIVSFQAYHLVDIRIIHYHSWSTRPFMDRRESASAHF